MSYDNIVTELERGWSQPASFKTLVIGLGNPILGDDGIGWQVAQAVDRALLSYDSCCPNVEVDCFALGGLSLMERLVGYERAIIIDAFQTSDGQPGQVHSLSLADLPELSTGHTTAAHDTSLQTAIRLGRDMGAELPKEVAIVGVEAKQVYEFSEELTPAVAAAIPEAVQTVMSLLLKKDLEPAEEVDCF